MYSVLFDKPFETKHIIKLMKFFDASNENSEYVMYLRSNGGLVDECEMLLDYMHRNKLKIHLVLLGFVASTAVNFALKLKALSKICTPHCQIMIHLPDINLSVKDNLAQPDKGNYMSKLYDSMVEDTIRFYKGLGLSKEHCISLAAGKDVFLTVEEFVPMLDKTVEKKKRPCTIKRSRS